MLPKDIRLESIKMAAACEGWEGKDGTMDNERLAKAKAARERHSKIDKVFREIIEKASLTRDEMIAMCKGLPDFDDEHMEYLSTAPPPDYVSFFGDIVSLYMASAWRDKND